MHQFEQTPIVIEVKDRNPKADDLVYSGPNVAGGWTHPVTGKVVSVEEHGDVVLALNKAAGRPKHVGDDYAKPHWGPLNELECAALERARAEGESALHFSSHLLAPPLFLLPQTASSTLRGRRRRRRIRETRLGGLTRVTGIFQPIRDFCQPPARAERPPRRTCACNYVVKSAMREMRLGKERNFTERCECWSATDARNSQE
jgi:hypothetical protein